MQQLQRPGRWSAMRQMVPRRSLNIRHSTTISTKIKNIRRKEPVPRSQREKSRNQITNTAETHFPYPKLTSLTLLTDDLFRHYNEEARIFIIVHKLAHAKLGKWISEEETDSLAKEWLKGDRCF